MDKQTIVVELTTDSKEETVALLDQLAWDWEECWRKIYKIRNSNSYRGRGCYLVGWPGIRLDLRR